MQSTNHIFKTMGLLTDLDDSIRRSQKLLFSTQSDSGYWCGELESNSSIEAEYIFLTHFLDVVDDEINAKVARHILSKQRDDGTWGQYFGAPGDLSTTVECYFALKLVGHSQNETYMKKARDFILSKGGLTNIRVFSKIWLALFGQWKWSGIPTLPVELMLLPTWFPGNIYDFAAWARGTIVPLLIVLDRKPTRIIPESKFIDELYGKPQSEIDCDLQSDQTKLGWESLFVIADWLVKRIEKIPWNPVRSFAIKKAESWILEHQEKDGSWGGIQPPWVYSLIALNCLGYDKSNPVVKHGLEGFNEFSIEEGDTLRIQACVSPLWDTALAVTSLLDSGIPTNDPSLINAYQYLVSNQILESGDWQIKAKNVPAGGWAFEFHNNYYPDVDDTAEIVLALHRIRPGPEIANSKVIRRAVTWVLGMQSSNGGWGAFDKDNTRRFIAKLPFADFGETIDPPSVDVTAHVIEMLSHLNYKKDNPVISKALAYIFDEQEQDGSWFGRWGVNYIYGIGAVLPALEKSDIDMSITPVRKAVKWLEVHQNEDGGWGESCSSYVTSEAIGQGPSTPSQTSWALIALLSAGEILNPVVSRGVQYLLNTQDEDGSWEEPYFTGTGFPGYGTGQKPDRYLEPGDHRYQSEELSAGFMLNYHMYRIYWPLTALGRYKNEILRTEENDPNSHFKNKLLSYAN